MMLQARGNIGKHSIMNLPTILRELKKSVLPMGSGNPFVISEEKE